MNFWYPPSQIRPDRDSKSSVCCYFKVRKTSCIIQIRAHCIRSICLAHFERKKSLSQDIRVTSQLAYNTIRRVKVIWFRDAGCRRWWGEKYPPPVNNELKTTRLSRINFSPVLPAFMRLVPRLRVRHELWENWSDWPLFTEAIKRGSRWHPVSGAQKEISPGRLGKQLLRIVRCGAQTETQGRGIVVLARVPVTDTNSTRQLIVTCICALRYIPLRQSANNAAGLGPTEEKNGHIVAGTEAKFL